MAKRRSPHAGNVPLAAAAARGNRLDPLPLLTRSSLFCSGVTTSWSTITRTTTTTTTTTALALRLRVSRGANTPAAFTSGSRGVVKSAEQRNFSRITTEMIKRRNFTNQTYFANK
ncbi:hypothetical protein Vretifemale_14659 [Volvox reticuliferus]|uniref:Uncharacterized protein n=1 Tax=Volvox reticuliferus TaxID=1737510 RepID=A0A8J4CPE0_9CHLO|nr:hypothetical protein Vretifemale_14659 [Volvox reticuliferus]